MAYSSKGSLPIERASKIGHLKIIQEPHINRLIEAFESVDSEPDASLGEVTGTIDLEGDTGIENVVAVDGSHAAIPNEILQHKRIAFVTAGAVVMRISQLRAMRESPIIDPRELSQQLRNSTHTTAGAIPLAGVVIPGETVVKSIRKSIDDLLRYSNLYDTLQFLISREWDPSYSMQEHMECYDCGKDIVLPRSKKQFTCSACGSPHTLADYLRITESQPDDWAREEAVINLRNVLETLMLFQLIISSQKNSTILERTLFIKDGPLLLRAQLSRLVEPIRAFLKWMRNQNKPVKLLGVEKSGALVEHLPLIRNVLTKPGNFFLPSIRYLHERIEGTTFDPRTYRNRVQYGAKLVVRLGVSHTVVLNIATGTDEFLHSPTEGDLMGFPDAVSVLSELLSYSHENALIPLVLANAATSISMAPSSEILTNFAQRVLEAHHV